MPTLSQLKWQSMFHVENIIENESITEGMNTWVKQNAEHWLRSVQLLSRVWLFLTPWTAALQDSLSITNSQFAQIRVHQVSDAIQPSHPLLSPSPPAFNLSQNQGNTDYSAIIKRRDQKQNYTTPCVTGGKKEILVFFFFFFFLDTSDFSPQSHSTVSFPQPKWLPDPEGKEDLHSPHILNLTLIPDFLL